MEIPNFPTRFETMFYFEILNSCRMKPYFELTVV